MPKITPSEISEILFESIKPYYKGYPTESQEPQFRKTLTGEEVENLLCTIHQLITTIHLGDDDGQA